jgi:hypothetical protein
MRKTAVLVVAMAIAASSANGANDSMVIQTCSKTSMLTVSLAAIKKITLDPFYISVDTGSVAQRPIGGSGATQGPISVVFTGTSAVSIPLEHPGLASAQAVHYLPGSISITFAMTAAGFARVSVVAGNGKKVRDLLSSRLAPGDHELSWDCMLSNSEPISPGLYQIVGTVDRKPAFCKAVIVK